MVSLWFPFRPTLQKGTLTSDSKHRGQEAEGAVEDYEASGHKRAEAAAHGALSMVRLARNELDLAASEQNQELRKHKPLVFRGSCLDIATCLVSFWLPFPSGWEVCLVKCFCHDSCQHKVFGSLLGFLQRNQARPQ